MSGQRPQNGLKLPVKLQQELGIDLKAPHNHQDRRRTGFAGRRKEQRKVERVQKKDTRANKYRRIAPTHTRAVEDVSSEDEDASKAEKQPGKVPSKSKAAQPHGQSNPRSIFRKPAAPEPLPPYNSIGSDLSSRTSSPDLVLDSSSKAFKDRAARDEAEIQALEKKLGLKTKKLPKSFDDDGLGDILDVIDSGDESKKRKREGDDWLRRKRRQAAGREESDDETDSEVDESSDDENERDAADDEEISNVKDDSDSEGFTSFGPESDDDLPNPVPIKQNQSQRENPYVAPIAEITNIAKYVPPSKRKEQNPDTEAVLRVRRQLLGYLNKLSEGNLVSILNDIEKLYQSNARQDVSSTLIDLLLGLFSDRSSLQPTFVILHASLIAAIYKVIGTDFAAELVSRLVERFETYNAVEIDTTRKETNNLISLISYLFTFHVISSTLVFDFLRLFLEELNENNTELLLRIVRDCGPQLRQEDPSSLKRMIQIMQNVTARMTADGQEMSVRTKFMIETIMDLKNNKMRAATSSAGVASEHITRMRKVLGSLNNRNIKASEPLRISREDIKTSDKRGKWWLVGASWKGNNLDDATDDGEIRQRVTPNLNEMDTEEVDLLSLAREYRMNTVVRRSIFVSVMSANDFQDAHIRLLKLRLKRSQEQEIPKVILRCATAERAYNHYYTLIARKLCSEKNLRMAFQFSLWDFFKRMGEERDDQEREDEDDEDDDNEESTVDSSDIVILAKMYGNLIVEGCMNIGVLKVLNLAVLKEQAKLFVELLLVGIMTAPNSKGALSEGVIVNVFGKTADIPQLVRPLQYFLKKQVRKTDLVSKKEQGKVMIGCKLAMDTLRMIETSTNTMR